MQCEDSEVGASTEYVISHDGHTHTQTDRQTDTMSSKQIYCRINVRLKQR